jgi:hypothetical protein
MVVVLHVRRGGNRLVLCSTIHSAVTTTSASHTHTRSMYYITVSSQQSESESEVLYVCVCPTILDEDNNNNNLKTKDCPFYCTRSSLDYFYFTFNSLVFYHPYFRLALLRNEDCFVVLLLLPEIGF